MRSILIQLLLSASALLLWYSGPAQEREELSVRIRPSLSVTGTGRTTGHIANLTISNTSDLPITVSPLTFYIPSDGKHQAYVARILEGVTIPPHTNVTILVVGYCADVHAPPVPAGEPMPPVDDWIPVGHIEAPEPLNPTGTYPTSVFPQSPVRAFDAASVPEITASPAYTPGTTAGSRIIVTWPGSVIPVGGTLDPAADPHRYALLIVRILEGIEEVADAIQANPDLSTPFASDPSREREAIIQQTFWICAAALQGNRYEKEDFTEGVYNQYEMTSGRTIPALPAEQKEQLDSGVDAFWVCFMATGIEAKVLYAGEGSPGEETKPRLQGEETVPGAPAEQEKRCIRYGDQPEIDGRVGYDLIGDLFARGLIPSDYVNDARFGRVAQKVNNLRAMHQSLRNVLTNEFNQFPCNTEDAHREGPQSFPDFPWENFFLKVDFCADNSGKNRLIDFLDPDADPAAVTEWLQQYEVAIGNLGLWNPGTTPYAVGFQNTIDRAMEGISDAYETFEEDMHVAMELRYNASRAESRLWQAVTTIVAAAMSAGIGAAAGGAAAALASAFISTTGFIWNQGLQALGADPEAAGLGSSILTLSMGVSSAWGAGLVNIIGEEIVTALPAQMLEAGADAMTQERSEGLILAMSMLDDQVWEAMLDNLDDDYDAAAIASFNAKRETLRAEVGRRVAELCKVLNSLEALMPALLKAQENAEEWLHSSYWKNLWQEAMDQWFDCCCEWSDGSGPSPAGSCVVRIPEFGYDPDN